MSALSVLCAAAMRPIVSALAQRFEQATGTKVVVEFTRSGLVRDRVRAGEAPDVVVTTREAIDTLVRDLKIVPGSMADVARSQIGVAVRAGAPRPDIASAAAFVRTLRAAKSVAYADPRTGSPSGRYLAQLFERLGLAAELKPKTRLIGGAGGHAVVVCDAVVRGEAEIGLQQICEILPVAGVDLVGPLPDDVQHVTVFATAITTDACNSDVAQRFVGILTSDIAAPIIKAAGME
jgi:molybdate transport system substrate-binding protein